jgi:hypothetical protein
MALMVLAEDSEGEGISTDSLDGLHQCFPCRGNVGILGIVGDVSHAGEEEEVIGIRVVVEIEENNALGAEKHGPHAYA